MNNIIITGANGFVGSHILENYAKSIESKHTIIAACRNKSKLPNWYQGETMTGDLLDDAYVQKLTIKAGVICHTAAWSALNGEKEKSKKLFLEPTLNLINTAVKNGVKRFIFLSAITSIPIEQKRVHSRRSIDDIWPHYGNILRIEKHLKKVSDGNMEVVILRVGYFTGKNYSLGLLPILLPRLKTHMVPYIKKGSTTLPLVDGEDIGKAFTLAAEKDMLEKYTVIDIVGKEIPKARKVFQYLHDKHKYPKPHFSIPFNVAHIFARFMQVLFRLLPGEPLIVPSIVLLLEETNANNKKAEKLLGYRPDVHWQTSIDKQIKEMKTRQTENMKMNKAD